MSDIDLQKECPAIRLLPHPTARSQAVASKIIPAGSVLVSVPCLASVLLEHEKGRRCDACHRARCVERPLRKCSGCASYWYCNAKCQEADWRAQHRRICKHYNKFVASSEYQQLQPHERLDSILLSHLVARNMSFPDGKPSSSMSIFQALMPWSNGHKEYLPICLGSTVSPDLLETLYSRFGNNNFVIHSHLSTFGHGIFPLASRLFNHSCLPNAAPRYALVEARPVVMEVIALRDISLNEEITIPYLDPALLQSRHQMLELSYGFQCHCDSCMFLQNVETSTSDFTSEFEVLGKQLTKFVGVEGRIGLELPTFLLRQLPSNLHGVLREEYITKISEIFSSSSHGGDYKTALDSGRTLLALYLLIYPQNYPQIGLHLLELAKVRWNAGISSDTPVGGVEERVMKGEVRDFLALSRRVLMVFGPEGDLEDSPLSQLSQLEKLVE